MNYKRFELAFLLIFYTFFFWWCASFGYFPAHQDGMYYDLVAQSIGSGKGFNVDFIWNYAVKPGNIVHPADNILQPAGSLIAGGFYYLFGISKRTAQVPMFLFFGLMTALLYLFVRKNFINKLLAPAAALLFITSTQLMVYAAGGGYPEGYYLFFVFLTLLFLGKALQSGGNTYFYLSGLSGGLSYLSRNEGGLTVLVLAASFFYLRKLQKRSGQKQAGLHVLLLSILIFAAVVSPWEIRNRIVLGGEANRGKYNYIFGTDLYDIYAYSKTYTPATLIKTGLPDLIHKLIVSYGLKIDAFIGITSWPLILFMLLGFISCIKKKAYFPVFSYFVITYLIMGFANRSGDQGGWNGIFVLLPFIIPMSLEGVDFFSSAVAPDPKRSKMIVIILASMMLLYNAGKSYSWYYLSTKNPDPASEFVKPVRKWISEQNTGNSVVYSYDPFVIRYHTGLKTIMIPPKESLETIFECMDRYKPDYLLLDTPYFNTLNDLYYGRKDYGRFKLVFEDRLPVKYGESGDMVKIFRISYPNRLRKG